MNHIKIIESIIPGKQGFLNLHMDEPIITISNENICRSHNLHHKRKLLNMYNPHDNAPWFFDWIDLSDAIEF